MSKRTLLAILAVIIYAAAAVFAGTERPWTATELPPQGMMKDIAAFDRYQFWAVGESGNMLETTDGGTTWTSIRQAQATSMLNAVSYDISTGVLAVGNGGVIVRFRPGAAPTEWTLDANYSLNGVDAENSTAIIVGAGLNDEPLVLRSTDGGLEFAPVEIELPNQRVVLTGVQFLSVSDVVIYGSVGGSQDFGSPLIYVSSDAGRTWSKGTIAPRDMVITGVQRVAGDWVAVGLQAGEEAGILRTTDTGATWDFESQPDMNVITDLVRGEGLDLMAFGIRVIEVMGEPMAITAEFRSTDGGRNWGVFDIADEGTIIHAARGGDKMIAVGFATNCYRRWYDRTIRRTSVVVEQKHLEIGNVPVNTRREVMFADVLKNYGTSAREITAIKLHGMDGVEVTFPTVGARIESGATQSFVFAHERAEEGTTWGVLTVYFDDLTSVALYVTSYTQVPVAETGLALVREAIEFGDITVTDVVLQQFEILENVSNEPITIEGVTMGGDDITAFGYAEMPEFPLVVQPGETFSLNVFVEPLTKGVFHALARVHTQSGAITIPIVAAVRQNAVDDVINFGTVPVGEDAEADLYFHHQLWNESLQVGWIEGPQAPFAVTSTTPLPFEGNPYDRFTVTVKINSNIPQTVASIVNVPWTFNFANFSRVDRRIVMAKIGAGDPTSVNEPIVVNDPVNIYPQPATSTATVVLPPNVAWTSLSLVDVQGRVLYSGEVPSGIASLDLNVSDLQAGMYTVVLRSINGVAMSPLMKN